MSERCKLDFWSIKVVGVEWQKAKNKYIKKLIIKYQIDRAVTIKLSDNCHLN